MNKEEYLNWIKTRSKDPSEWSYEDAKSADRLIEQEAINNLKKWLTKQSIALPVKQFILTMAQASFGCEEVDDFLTEMGFYPEWMEKNEEAE